MSDDDVKPCPAGVAWCTDHETAENDEMLHRLSIPRTASAWQRGTGWIHYGTLWKYKISVSGAQWCGADGNAVDNMVTVHQDGAGLFNLEAEEAYTLAIALLEAVFKVADYHDGAIQEYVVGDLEQVTANPVEAVAA